MSPRRALDAENVLSFVRLIILLWSMEGQNGISIVLIVCLAFANVRIMQSNTEQKALINPDILAQGNKEKQTIWSFPFCLLFNYALFR